MHPQLLIFYLFAFVMIKCGHSDSFFFYISCPLGCCRVELKISLTNSPQASQIIRVQGLNKNMKATTKRFILNCALRSIANVPLAIRKAMHLFISVFNIYFDMVFVLFIFSVFCFTVFPVCCHSLAAVLYLNYLFEVFQELVHLVSQLLSYCCKYFAVSHLIE